MTAPVWARQFAGGVADAAGRHALWPNAAGCLVAIDLATGQRMWRSIEPMRPLLLNDHRALALAFNPPRIVALAIDAPEETELLAQRPAALAIPGRGTDGPHARYGVALGLGGRRGAGVLEAAGALSRRCGRGSGPH